MADRNRKTPENVPGPFYVDDTCIDCDVCRTTAPAFYRRQDEGGYSYIWRQPVSPEEFAEAQSGMGSCPTDSIGNDGG